MTRIAFVAVLAASVACRPAADTRETRDFERMRTQQRYDAYGRSRFFANGAVLQAPPAHTIARDPLLASRGQTATMAFLTGASNSAPVADVPSGATAVAGAGQFAISCAPCHGAAGFGGGAVAPNLIERRPPSLRSAKVAALAAGTIYSVITNGVGRMPPYGWQMTPSARWAVVAYVRSLTTQPTTLAARSDSGLAASLQRTDSLRAAGARLDDLVRARDTAR